MSRPIDPRLLGALPRVRTLLAGLTVLQAVGGVLSVAQAILLADIIGAQFVPHRPGVTGRLILLGAVGVARAAVAAGQEWAAARSAADLAAGLRSLTLSAIVRLGPAWSARQPAGRLLTAAGTGLEAVEGYVTRALPTMVASCVVPPLVFVAIAVADWQSAVVLLVVLPLIPVFMVLVGMTTRRRMVRQYAALTALAGHFLDLVQGLTTLKIYGQAHRQRETVERDAENYRRTTMGMLKMAFMSGLVLDLVATLGIAVVAVDVGLRLDAGHLTLTRALVVLLLAPELFAPLRAVGAQFHANEAGQAAIGAALDIVGESGPAPVDGCTDAGLFTGGLRFEGVSIRYPDRSGRALDDVWLDVAAGQVVGIQGMSGAGKSTLLASVLGFAAGESVSRSTDEGWVAATATDPRLWRASLAWVPQHPAPTQSTVADEVRLGDPAATPAEVNAALRECRAPEGGTSLGEDGRLVSAGERRRVALARVLLRARRVMASGQVPIVLLDEPSEDLDEATQSVVLAVIAGLSGRATVLIASHSETVLATADTRVVLAAGRVTSVAHQRPVRDHALLTAPEQARRVGADTGVTAPPSRHLLRSPARRLVVPAFISGAAGLCGLALTATSIWLICRAAERPNVQALALAVVGVRTFALGRALLRYAERLTGHDAALRLVRDVRGLVFAGLIPLAPAGLDAFRRGDLLRRFATDVDAVQEGLVRAAIPTAGAVITSVGATCFAAVIEVRAGLLLGAGLVAAIALLPLATTSLAGSGASAAGLSATRDARTCATVEGLAELTAYGAAEAAVSDIGELSSRAVQAARRSAAAAGAGSLLTGLLAALTLVALLTVGVQARGVAPVSLGLLLACVLAGFDAVTPLPAAFAAWGRFTAARNRVRELIERPPVMPVGRRTAPNGRTGLHAARLDLAATADGPLLVAGLTLTMAPGQRVAVMGASGCGKSTLLAAAMRLHPIAGGNLWVTGDVPVALAAVSETSVPALIAGSLQGDHVFNVSLRDNLRVVLPGASDSQLEDVAAAVGLLAFVRGLPGGWSTNAGPDGCAVSGGERQRLLLARALLAEPSILVLDEPTAHLDAVTEQTVLNGLFGARAQTMLISTHRGLPENSYDTLLEFRDSRLVEREPIPTS